MREFDWIAKARQMFGDRHAGAPVGIGDDCALLECHGPTLVSTDTVVAGVHLDLAVMSYADVGWRALAVALSDLAACGADVRRPLSALVSLQMPPDLADDDLLALAEGLLECAKAHACDVVGGDTVATPGPLAVTVTVVGSTDRPVLRSTARADNVLVVTGPLGAAGVGLAALRAGLTGDDVDACATAYRRPRAHLECGAVLAQHAAAMIDLSDGLIQDLGHICHASGLGAEIALEDMPVAAATAAVAAKLGLDAPVVAATFGDDYHLLACVHPTAVDALRSRVPGLAQVGRMTSDGGVCITRNGRVVTLDRAGYEHGS